MHSIIEAKPLENYHLWIKFADGTSGTVDLSGFVGKGIFSAWKDKDFFNSVRIDRDINTVVWGDDIDLCPDNLYAQVKGVDPSTILDKVNIAG